MLSVTGLHSGYGRIQVLHGVDLAVAPGKIAAIIGANGAGKTTLLMTICGRPRANQGTILFDGEDITQTPTFMLARRGIAHVPEGRHIFDRMSVLENLQMGAFAQAGVPSAGEIDSVLTLFPALKPRLSKSGGTLSGGEQQMLAIARALMMRPRLLLLDEPSLGLAPLIAAKMFEAIRTINRERGTTVILVEQNAVQALKLADEAHVMVNGRIARQGTGVQLLQDHAIQSAYLDGGFDMQHQTGGAP